MTTLSGLERALGSTAVFAPGSDEYAAATRPANSSFPQQPAAVVRPRSAEDVARAVGAARDLGLAIVVQATGHGSGSAIPDDTLLIDMSQLAVVSVESGRSSAARLGRRRRARSRAGPS